MVAIRGLSKLEALGFGFSGKFKVCIYCTKVVVVAWQVVSKYSRVASDGVYEGLLLLFRELVRTVNDHLL